MSSPFLDEKLAKAIVINGPAEVVDFEYKGIKSTLGMYKNPLLHKKLKMFILYTPYDSFVQIKREVFNLDDVLEEIDEKAKILQADKINLKLGFVGETALRPELTNYLIDKKLPCGFSLRERDVIGLVDLRKDFSEYLASLKSGCSRYFTRTIDRGLYETRIWSEDLTREEFDIFLSRVKLTYKRNNYGFKSGSVFWDSIYECFATGMAKLIEVRAKNEKDVWADLLILHDGVDAYAFAGSRSIGKGAYIGVGHFAHISIIKFLSDNGFLSYTLGYVNERKDLPLSERGVRNFKRNLSTNYIPLLHLCKENNKSKIYFFLRKMKDSLLFMR